MDIKVKEEEEEVCKDTGHRQQIMMIIHTPDDKKNDIIPNWKPSLQPPISRPNLYQIQQARTVSKSARPEDSEFDLGFKI